MQKRQAKPEHPEKTHANAGRICKLHTEMPADPVEARVSILAYWMPDCSSTPNSVGPADQCLQYYHKLLGRCVDTTAMSQTWDVWFLAGGETVWAAETRQLIIFRYNQMSKPSLSE
ncbi:uncharacterized protein isoform X3 [Danio rerio]|uniref:Uncharacterized protein isoform X3 n=22 Tax=Danio rerio TaxID=7955 RepID=A0AC58IG53_DANRE